MKKAFNRMIQPRSLLILAALLIQFAIIQFFIEDWLFKIVGFFFVLLINNLLLYRLTDSYHEYGIFTDPAYNLGASLLGNFLLCLVVYYSHPLNPIVTLSMLFIAPHFYKTRT